MTLSQTTQLILWGAVLIIVLPLAFNIYQTVSKSDDELCRLSVMQHAAVHTLTKSIKDVEFECNRKTITIGDDHVEIDGKIEPVRVKDKIQTKFDTLDEDIVNQVMADEMYRCWRKMGQGDLDVFASDFAGLNNNICLVCAIVDFDVDQNNMFTGLDNYLSTKYINHIEDRSITYKIYLEKQYPNEITTLGYTIPWSKYFTTGTHSSLNVQDINTDKTYAIYFYAWKPTWTDAIAKAYDNMYYLMAAEIDTLTSNCDYIYN